MHWGKHTSLTRTAVLAVIFRTFPCAKSGHNMDFSTNSWSLSGTRNWLLGGGGGGDCERCNTGADVALPAPAIDGSQQEPGHVHSTRMPQVSQSLCGALAAGPALCAEGCTDASMEEDKLRLVGHCIYFGNLAPAFCAAQASAGVSTQERELNTRELR